MEAIILAIILLSIGCSDTPAEKAQDKEIEELKKRVTALEQKPVQHHYELRNEGSRSFRFDPDTGTSCIQLASTADWKNPETIRQGCQYQDFINAPMGPSDTYVSRYATAECAFVGKCDAPK